MSGDVGVRVVAALGTRAGWSVEQAAQRLGVSVWEYREIEAGEAALDVDRPRPSERLNRGKPSWAQYSAQMGISRAMQ